MVGMSSSTGVVESTDQSPQDGEKVYITYEELVSAMTKEPYNSVYDSTKDCMILPRYDSVFLPADLIDTVRLLTNTLSSVCNLILGDFIPLKGLQVMVFNGKTTGKVLPGKFIYKGNLYELTEELDFELDAPHANKNLRIDIKYHIATGAEDSRLTNLFWGSSTFGESASDRVSYKLQLVEDDINPQIRIVDGYVEGCTPQTVDGGTKFELNPLTKTLYDVLK